MDEKQVRTRQPKAHTRAAILSKAYEMYIDRRLVHGDERLASVLDELGYPRSAGYRIWPASADFRRDLQIYVAENVAYSHSIASTLVALEGETGAGVEDLLSVGDRYMEAMLDSAEFPLMLRFYADGQDRAPEITKALAETYERSQWEGGELFSTYMNLTGRKMREPFELSDLTTAITALVEGYALRAQFRDQEVSQGELKHDESNKSFSRAFALLFESMTEST